MNYYEHHLGDFKKDAAHLTMIQEGAYRRLIDAYYIREAPLPGDPDELVYQLAGAHTKAEKVTVDFILEQFFKFDPTVRGFRHKRCDEEIARFKAKSTAGKTGANARWSHNGRNGIASANGMRPHSDADALQSPDSNPQSPVKSPTPNPSPAGEGPVRETRAERKDRQQEALQRWNRLVKSDGADRQGLAAAMAACGGWPAIRMRTEADDARLRKTFVDAYLASTTQ